MKPSTNGLINNKATTVIAAAKKPHKNQRNVFSAVGKVFMKEQNDKVKI